MSSTRAGARDVREVDARACVADERYAARDVDFLGGSGDALKPRHGADASLVDLSALEEAYLLRVLHDARQTLAGVEQSEAKKVARRDGRTVVGEEYRSGLRHLLHLADFLAFALLADAARGQYARGLRRRAVAQHVLDERGLGDCGLVFGIATSVVKPPAAPAIAPLLRSSFHSSPGSRKCACSR